MASVIARVRPALLAVSAVSAMLALGAGSAVAQTEATGEEAAQTERPREIESSQQAEQPQQIERPEQVERKQPTERLYVIEQLVVSVHSEPEGGGERVDQIKSGDRVDVLERQGDEAHVRLASGQEGWVRSSYLSAAPPMREQLEARTRELEKLRAEKTKLETELASARKAASAAAAAAAKAAPQAPEGAAAAGAIDPPSGGSSAGGSSAGASSTVASVDAAPSNPPMFASESIVPSRPSWLAALAVSVLTLIAGFVLGWRVLDKRIRAKYGGLRIY